jgi:hypothetical protein
MADADTETLIEWVALMVVQSDPSFLQSPSKARVNLAHEDQTD